MENLLILKGPFLKVWFVKGKAYLFSAVCNLLILTRTWYGLHLNYVGKTIRSHKNLSPLIIFTPAKAVSEIALFTNEGALIRYRNRNVLWNIAHFCWMKIILRKNQLKNNKIMSLLETFFLRFFVHFKTFRPWITTNNGLALRNAIVEGCLWRLNSFVISLNGIGLFWHKFN